MHSRSLILLLIATVYTLQSYAQRYPFYNLGVEDGLIQSQVTSMTQDADGHLWVGTYGGVSRFDGQDFSNYTVRKGLLSNTIQTIAIDEDNNLWLGGPKGISKYNGRKFEHFLFESPENNTVNQVRDIKVSGKDIWCYTTNEVYKISDSKMQKISMPDSTIVITAILSYKDTLLVGDNSGHIFRYANKQWDTLYYHIPGMQHPPLLTTNIYRTKTGEVYITSREGAFKMRNDSIKVVIANGRPMYNIPFISIAEDSSGAIWLGTAGVIKLKDGTATRYNRNNGFTDNAITSIIADKEGNVWFGSDGQGIFRFSGSQFSIMDEQTGLQSEQVVGLTSTPSGKVYIGTYVDGLFVYDNKELRQVPLNYKNPYISCLAVQDEYNIWMGTGGIGLCQLKGNERIYHRRPELPSNTITALYIDKLKRLWVGTSHGAVIYHNRKFTSVDIPAVAVVGFGTIGTDSILIATNNGLQLYHDSIVTSYATNTPADKSSPQCLYVQDDVIWIGTRDNGLIRYNPSDGKHLVLNNDNGLQSDFIYNIIEDNNRDIWVGTGFGIHKVHMDGNNADVTFYGKEQGITGMESNHNAVTKTPDGTLWFGTMKGLVHIDPEVGLIESEPISVVLQSIKLFGDNIRDTTYYDSTSKWYGIPHNLRLPYKKNNVTFSFKGISLSGTKQLRYRYKMEGLTAPWSDWTDLNSVTYSALPPGNYTLKVECKGHSDVVRSMNYPFEIITPIHKTSWFSFTIFGMCILSGVGIQYLLNKRKQNRLALVEKLRREEQGKVRQRTAEDFHDEVGNKLTRINVLTNVLKQKVGNDTPDATRIINQIQENTSLLYSGTRDILWSLQPANDSLYEILHRIRDFGTDLFADTEVQFEFKGTDQLWHNYKLPLDMSRNLIMICKEAMNNALKYADAGNVKVQAILKEKNILHLSIIDDGKGFDQEAVTEGNGLKNMHNRTKRLNGKIYIDSKQNSGTSINLHFKLPDNSKKQMLKHNK